MVPDPDSWRVQPWVFIPQELEARYKSWIQTTPGLQFQPRLTFLEDIAPWKVPDLATLAAKAKAEKLAAEVEDNNSIQSGQLNAA